MLETLSEWPFREVGIEVDFRGTGVDEKGYVASVDMSRMPVNTNMRLPIGHELVGVDPRYFRPTEVELLIGDPTKAKTTLGWEPRYDLAAMVGEMVQADLKLFQQDQLLKAAGFQIKNEFE